MNFKIKRLRITHFEIFMDLYDYSANCNIEIKLCDYINGVTPYEIIIVYLNARYKNNEAIHLEGVINEFRMIRGNFKERTGK